MGHGEKYESAYRVMGRWAIDLILFVALIIAGLFALSNCAGTTDTPSTGSLGLAIIPGALFAQEFEVEGSDPTGACCYEKVLPDGSVRYDCESPRTENFCDNHQNGTWSEGLTCDQVSCPPIELGSCCLDCEPGSGGDDSCEDETTEPFCEEAGGRWELNTLCGERLDCQDQCPVPRGSCCVGCVDGSGRHDECEDGVVETSCSNLGGSWLEEIECAERDDCSGFCPEPVGAICTPDGWPPSDDPNPEDVVCVDEINLNECVNLFDVEYCDLFWEVGKSCDELHCREVPAMPRWALVLLLVVLCIGAGAVLHSITRTTDGSTG